MEAIEQIFAEVSAFDAVEQLAIGGGDDADIDFYRLASADRFHRALLQCAQ